jgi:hypothetical protein
MMLHIKRTMTAEQFRGAYPQTAALVIGKGPQGCKYAILDSQEGRPIGCVYTGPEIVTIRLADFLSHPDWGFFLVQG